MFNNKDELCKYFLSGHLHLSKKDFGFYTNIFNTLKSGNQITSNQDKLFNKLILKYQRQLFKLGYDPKLLQDLQWIKEILQSKEEYLHAYVSITEDEIRIRSPFKTAFVQEMRKTNLFEWEKNKKYYKARANTYALKAGLDITLKYFEQVKYCDKVSNILNNLNSYIECKYWTPTLVTVHGQFYIASCNEHILKAIGNTSLNDDPKTIFTLSQSGVEICDIVKNKNDLIKFAGSHSVTFDLNNMDVLVQYLNLLNIHKVALDRNISHNRKISHEIQNNLTSRNIECLSYDKAKNETILIRYGMLRSHKIGINNFLKIINLTNSRPVEVL